MKKWLGLVLLGVIALSLVCTSNSVSPLSDNYDQATMVKVEVVGNYGNGYGLVQISWLVEKLGTGDKPYSFGPLDAEWTVDNMTSLSKKSADGKYYVYTAVVEFGTRYNVGAGLTHSGSVIRNFRWLTPNEQAGCAYFDPSSGNMAFVAYANYVVTP